MVSTPVSREMGAVLFHAAFALGGERKHGIRGAGSRWAVGSFPRERRKVTHT